MAIYYRVKQRHRIELDVRLPHISFYLAKQ